MAGWNDLPNELKDKIIRETNLHTRLAVSLVDKENYTSLIGDTPPVGVWGALRAWVMEAEYITGLRNGRPVPDLDRITVLMKHAPKLKANLFRKDSKDKKLAQTNALKINHEIDVLLKKLNVLRVQEATRIMSDAGKAAGMGT